MKIEAVLFDVDGVVVFPWRFARYLEQVHAITRDMTRHFFHGVFNDCVEGRADLRAVLGPYLAQWRWPGSVDEFVATWLKQEDAADRRVLEEVARLRARGILCGVATIQERYRAEYMRTAMHFAEHFDRLFFSYELRCQKPEPRFYHEIARALGLAPGAILFWDDNAANVAAARACGWQAEVYRDYASFAGTLKEYTG